MMHNSWLANKHLATWPSYTISLQCEINYDHEINSPNRCILHHPLNLTCELWTIELNDLKLNFIIIVITFAKSSSSMHDCGLLIVCNQTSPRIVLLADWCVRTWFWNEFIYNWITLQDAHSSQFWIKQQTGPKHCLMRSRVGTGAS